MGLKKTDEDKLHFNAYLHLNHKTINVFVLVVKMQRIKLGPIHTLEISSTQDCTVLRLVLWIGYSS